MGGRAYIVGVGLGAGALALLLMPRTAGASSLPSFGSGASDLGALGLEESQPGGGFGDYIPESVNARIDDLLGIGPGATELGAMSADDNVGAFLTMIKVAEHGTDDAIIYQRLFGGDLFDSFADHPRVKVTRKLGGKEVTSTAAGAYQILARTWDSYRGQWGLSDFTPASQDAFAVGLLRVRGALGDVQAGRFESAVRKCANEWASLPGSPYGQPTINMARAAQLYTDAGGVIA